MRFAAAALLVAMAACTRGSTPSAPNAPTTLDPRPPLPGASAEVGIPYAPTRSSAPTLDLFRPKKGKAPYPVVIRFGGGAEGPTAAAITDAGYAIAVVHLPPDARLLDGARHAKAAVRFLRANAEKYELDPERFIAWGSADGGWFAVMLGVTGDQATPFDDLSLGHASTSSAVQVVIDWAGPTDFGSLDADERNHPSPACSQTYQRHALAGTKESQWVCGDKSTALTDPPCANAVHDADLASYVPTAKKLPAFYLAHGADDCVVSIWQTVRVLEALKKRDEQPGFHRMSRAGHEDPRFELEEGARSLAFINEAFHPEAGAKSD